jgi:hypothetical protein
VFVDPSDEVVCHANIERAIPAAGQEVDEVLQSFIV